jgi:DNA primase
MPELPAIAHEFFLSQRRSSWVPAYLTGRGFPEEVQRRFQIGYAPAAWRTLTSLFRSYGFSDDRQVASGLVRRSRHGRLYDLFRDRVMFAIRNRDGSIAGFIGRTAEGVGGPKYLNSPESPHFRKGRLLYGLHESRGRPVVVEGPLDAIAVRLAGFTAVSPCGPRLTSHQAALLGDNPLLALDGDPAGLRGALHAWDLFDGPINAVVLPPGMDPADLLRTGGPAAVRAVLRHETPLIDLAVDEAIGRHRLRFIEGQVAAARAAAEVIARIRNDDAARQVARVAARLAFDHAEITTYVIEALERPPTTRQPWLWSDALTPELLGGGRGR